MKFKKRFCVLMSVLVFLVPCISATIPTAYAEEEEAEVNYDIQLDEGCFTDNAMLRKHWNAGWVNTGSTHKFSEESHTADGTGSIKITHVESCVASYAAEKVHLVENAKYKVSGWIKGEDVVVTTNNDNGGAYFAFDEHYNFYFGAVGVNGSWDWTYYEAYFTATYTGDHKMECKLWGAYGTAWFDDIKIELVDKVDPEVAKHWTENVSFPTDDDGFTIIGVGDTQGFAGAAYSSRFFDCYEYMVSKKEEYNIQYVMHLGDIVDNAEDSGQWTTAAAAHKKLQDADLRYSLSMGNHDYIGLVGLASGEYIDRDTSVFNKYFARANYDEWLGDVSFGAFDEDTMNNTWHKFEVGEDKYLIVALEYGPNDAVLEWAKRVVDDNPDRHVIVTTHCYMDTNGNLHDEATSHLADANGGNGMWEKFVRRCPNIFMVLNGHFVGYGVSTSVVYGDAGNPIIQMKVDPQNILGGGEPMLALYRITNGTDVSVYYYSTFQNKYYAGSNFSIEMVEGGESGVIERDQNTAEKLFAYTVLDGTEARITYDSSDKTVATVDADGTVHCISPGTTTISCYVDSAQSAYATSGVMTKYTATLNVNAVEAEGGDTSDTAVTEPDTDGESKAGGALGIAIAIAAAVAVVGVVAVVFSKRKK